MQISLNELQRFAKNFFFKISSTIISGVLSILVVSHLSKALTPDGFGKYSFLITYTSYFIFLTSLGTDIVAIRIMSVQKEKIKTILGSLISLKLLLTIAVFIIMIVPMIFVDKLRGFGWVLIIFSITILPFPFSVQSVFEATKRIEFPSIISIISQLVNFILIILFVKSPDDLLFLGIILVSINVLIFITHNFIFIKYYGRWKWSFDKLLWTEFLKNGIVIGFIQIVSNMNHFFDILLLGFMKTDQEVGIYSAAYRVMFMIISVMSIIINLIMPILFENYKLNLEKYKFYFNHFLKFLVFFTYITACLSFFLAFPVLNIFYDLNKYHDSILCFQILSCSIFLIGVNSPYNIGLLSMHKEKQLLGIITTQFIINIIANLILIPKYGIYGSSISTVISDLIGVPLYIISFTRVIKISIWRNYALATISIIPMALVLYFLNINFILKALIGVAVMFAFTLLIKGYTIEELQFIRKTLFDIKIQKNKS